MSEAQGWATRFNAGEVVMVEGHSDGFVLVAVGVGMTYKGCLVMLSDR